MQNKFTSGLLCLLAAVGCNSQPDQSKAAPQTEPAAATTGDAQSPAAPAINVAGLANCEATAPLTSAIERIAQLADTNGDGEVAKTEAMALSNFALGGAFFRADTNGDGTVTPDEGRAVRVELLQRYPELEALVLAARASGRKTFALPASLGDVEYGKPLAIADVRTAAAALVDDLFAVADKNKNGSIGMDEARATSLDGARALGRAAFDKTDKNHDGALTQEELAQLVDAPLRQAFDLADVDKNGRLSAAETTAALSLLARTVGIPSTAAAPSVPTPPTAKAD